MNPYLSSQSLGYFSSATMGKYPCGQTIYCAGEKLEGILKFSTQLSSSFSFSLFFEMGVKGFEVGIKGAKLKSGDSMRLKVMRVKIQPRISTLQHYNL